MLRSLTRLALVTLALGACGDDAANVDTDADIGDPEFTVQNMDDSGVLHSVTFRCAKLVKTTPQTFVSDGPHAHSLRLEVADMQRILAGELVEVIFTDGHEHRFAIQKPETACVGLDA